MPDRPPGWLATILIPICLAGASFAASYGAANARLEALHHDLAEHKSTTGHTGISERVRKTEERLAAMDEYRAGMAQLLESIDRRLERIERALAGPRSGR